MNIQISENIDRALSGFNLVPIVYGEVDLNGIPDNAASSIIAIDAIDSVSYTNLPRFIATVIQKMRLNCKLYLGGTDVYAISRALISGNIDTAKYNELMTNKKSFCSVQYILSLLKNSNLSIESVVFKGNNYEITAIRPEHKNKL